MELLKKWLTYYFIINLHLNEYNHELQYYPFVVKLDKFVGSCNTFNDLSNRVSVLNNTEDLNIHVSNIITGKNESNILTKDISCKFICGFDGKNIIRGEYRPFLRSVTAFGRTKIGAQILINQLKI